MSSIAVQNSIHYLPDMVAVGMQGSIMMLVSIYIGESDTESLHNLLRVVKKYFLLLILPISVLGVLLSSIISHLYIVDSEEVIKLATFAIVWYFGCLPFSAFNDCYIGFYQGMKRNKVVNSLMLFGRIILPLTMSLTLGAIWGPYGLIASLGISSIAMTLGIIFVQSVKQKRVVSKFADLIELPKELDNQDHHIYYTTVKTIEEAAQVSAALPEALQQYNLPKREVHAISLCIEEMVRRIIENSGDKTAKPFVDISIAINNDEVEIHFRDNLKQNDFCESMKECWDSDNPSEYAGYKILAGMSSDIRYMFLLDTNVISLKIKGE